MKKGRFSEEQIIAVLREHEARGLVAAGEVILGGVWRGLTAARALLLDRRTWHGAERTEHAAIAWIGAQHGPAVSAFVKEYAGVDRHRFLFRKATIRTG